jgi:hypothetical protein
VSNRHAGLLAETVTLNLRQATYESMLWRSTGTKQRDPARAVERKLSVGNLTSSRIGTELVFFVRQDANIRSLSPNLGGADLPLAT